MKSRNGEKNRWRNKNNRSKQTKQMNKQNMDRQIDETNETAQEQIQTKPKSKQTKQIK